MWVSHLPWWISCHMNKIWKRILLLASFLLLLPDDPWWTVKTRTSPSLLRNACQIIKHSCTLHEVYGLRTLFVHTTWHINRRNEGRSKTRRYLGCMDIILTCKCLLVDIFLNRSLSKSLAFCKFASFNFESCHGCAACSDAASKISLINPLMPNSDL